MILKAPAKINLFLLIEGRREDGYHNITSLMQRVSLYDTLTFEDFDEIAVASDLDLPVEDNLVFKAAKLLSEYSSCGRGARINLVKDIPSAAGLGGGSSDAATTLMGLNGLWGLGLDKKTLMLLGARLGSDVPFFLGPPFSLVGGRGEEVRPLKSESPFAVLLVKPDISISTAWAYSNYNKLTKKMVDIKLFCQALDRKDFASLRRMAFNDLEDAVIHEYQVIDAIKRTLIESGAEISLMSGSGSTVFGVFSTHEKALKAAEKMGNYWCRAVSTIVHEEA
jgi:4-diphosphocytidyl-2-C-methyl-D-erythritol kinase